MSSTRNGYDPAKILDGNSETWWFAAQNTKQWVVLELPKATTFKGSSIIWEKDSTWYNFSIDVSQDGQQWRQVYKDVQTGHDEIPELWNAATI